MASRISRSDHLFQQISTNWIRSERKMNDSADLDTAFFEMLEDVNQNYQEDKVVAITADHPGNQEQSSRLIRKKTFEEEQ